MKIPAITEGPGMLKLTDPQLLRTQAFIDGQWVAADVCIGGL